MSQVIVVNNSLKIANTLCDILENRDMDKVQVAIEFDFQKKLKKK